MREILRHTPLFALEAVAFDTETTGLQAKTARIIEMAAVEIHGGGVDPKRALSRLVALSEPIPAAASAVHGIFDSDLVGAAAFKDALAEVMRYIGDRPVIGHMIGFDLAVLGRECAGAGVAPPQWVCLDTHLLAQTVAPDLADYTLETLASWLGPAFRARHRALADATLTAEIFVALLPRLRNAGILTLGDAQQACRGLTRTLERYHSAGWVEPGADLPEADRLGTERRLDSYPYRHRVRDVMSRPPIIVLTDATISDALATMTDKRVSSVFVGRNANALDMGIVTERDIVRAIRRDGEVALGASLSSIAARPLIHVHEDAFVYRALGRMARFKIRHLAAVTADGTVSGALSARDLLRVRTQAAIVLGDDIDQAADVAALARAWAKVPALAADLLDEDVGARDIAGIVARELGALTRRAGNLAMQRLAKDGRGAAPCRFAVLVLGSAGRGESLLALDQDHAVVFETGKPGGPEDAWFAELGRHLAEILDTVGVPLCPGNVMASNRQFRGSLATWRDRIAQWVGLAAPEDLLSADIFFDFRPVMGDGRLADALWHTAWTAAGGSAAFLRLLAEAGRPVAAPVGFFGSLKTENGRVDLKRHGLRPIVESARLLALRHGVAVRSTAERLDGVQALGVGGAHDLIASREAHERFLGLILRTQLRDRQAGRPASNAVPMDIVQKFGGSGQLKADLRVAVTLNELALDQLNAASP